MRKRRDVVVVERAILGWMGVLTEKMKKLFPEVSLRKENEKKEKRK